MFNDPEANVDAEEKVSGAVAIPNELSGDLQALNQKVNSMMEKSQNMILVGTHKRPASICKVCGKEAYATDIRDHIEAKHLEGISLPCDHCDKTFSSRHSLRMHKSRFHN